MGLPANKKYELEPYRNEPQASADLTTIPGTRKSEVQPITSTQVSRFALETANSAGKVIAEAEYRARAFYADAVATTQRLMRRAREQARYRRRERPMQALGTLAATALVCGILLRIWRSNKS
jgi:ElaB/YqjD/DUF883 family membrane-anchored ribosome-binding protein